MDIGLAEVRAVRYETTKLVVIPLIRLLAHASPAWVFF
jgi:hypothetical protein